MRNFKRLISGSLATVMIAAAMMTGASAKSYDDVASTNAFAEQIELLSDIGVIKGTTENQFSPDENVTREQMALLLFRLMIGKDNPGKINSTDFTDLYDETYHGAISWANASGYILGTSATTFAPTAGIMLQDAMTMLVRALGHDTKTMNAGYPWTYIDTAIKLGLDDGLEKVDYEKTLTRAEVAAILYNAITAEYLIPKTAPNGMTYYETTTIIERIFGYELAECVLVATNAHALEGVATVTKDGYVTVHTEDGLITVKYSDLGLAGDADTHLGKSLRLVYKRDSKTKLVEVLGCAEIGKSVPATEIEIEEDFEYILIDDVKYQVVEELSDELDTNENELLVYAYAGTKKLRQIDSNEELAEILGAFDAHIIYDSKDSEIADRLIIKPFKFDQLDIDDGEINIAGGMDEDDLTVKNPYKAESGDYVLYYFNKDADVLEIAALLPVSKTLKVTRLTKTTATIGGTKYTLGCEGLGITPESIHDKLAVGEEVKVVAYGDMILAIDETSISQHTPSKYLIAHSGTTPVFSDGKFGYVMEAVIDGKIETIFVERRTVTEGEVYRYLVDSDDVYTLIPVSVDGGVIESGDEEFVQDNKHNSEIAFVIDSALNTTVDKSASHYIIDAGDADSITSTGNDESRIKFVTDKKTVILVKKDGEWTVNKGVYGSTVTVNDGAKVTAVFENEVGSVETLRYLIIDDGSLGSIDASATSVKIIASEGRELINGTVYSVYTVLDHKSGKIVTMQSKHSSLTVGANYLTDVNGLISATEADVTSGILSGYTSTTVTVGGTTYTVTEDTIVTRLTGDEKEPTESIKIEDALMGKVELILDDGKVISVVLVEMEKFSAEYAGGKIAVSADELTDADSFSVSAMWIYDEETGKNVSIDISEYTVSEKDGETFGFEITPESSLEAGDYTVSFKVNGIRFTVKFTVE